MRKSKQIRLKSNPSNDFFRDVTRMSRSQAIHRVREALEFSSQDTEAMRLIGLFSIGAEELSEAGISYEMLKVLERQALFI